MSALGHKRTCAMHQPRSALPTIADMCGALAMSSKRQKRTSAKRCEQKSSPAHPIGTKSLVADFLRDQQVHTKEYFVTELPPPPSWKSRAWRCLIALLLLALTAQAEADKSLDFAALETPNGANLAMWRELKSGIEEEQKIITKCRSDPATCPSSAALQFVALVNEGTRYEGRARIGHINRAANLSIRATKKYLEKWTPPLETLAKGIGDCKQYAVLKYVALNEAGYDVDRLRIIVVEGRMMRSSHAVVAVRSGEQWIVLDNHSYALVESSEFLRRYTSVALLPQLLRRKLRTAEDKARNPE